MANLTLSGPQRGKFREALMDAYPSVNALQVMVQDELDENLLAIIPFTADLVAALRRFEPQNLDLV